MTDFEYQNLAEALLRSIEAGCDRLNDLPGVDIDNQRTGGMVTMEFANRSQIIINLQKPLQEVWMAARAGGFHYRASDDGRWLDTKTSQEFFADLSCNATAQAGLALVFTAK